MEKYYDNLVFNVGNIVTLSNINGYGYVVSVSYDITTNQTKYDILTVGANKIICGVLYNELVPIVITTELLDMLGIEWVDDNPKMKPHYDGDILFYIEYSQNNYHQFTNSMVDGFISWDLGRTIKYVHELQNINLELVGHPLMLNTLS